MAAFQAVINTSFSRGSQNITFVFQHERSMEVFKNTLGIHYFIFSIGAIAFLSLFVAVM